MANTPNPPFPIQPVSPLTSPNLGASATGLVTPSDTTVFPYATRALWIGGTGNVTVTLAQGALVTLSAVPTGTLLPVACTQVRATGTTATLIVALN